MIQYQDKQLSSYGSLQLMYRQYTYPVLVGHQPREVRFQEHRSWIHGQAVNRAVKSMRYRCQHTLPNQIPVYLAIGHVLSAPLSFDHRKPVTAALLPLAAPLFRKRDRP